MFQLMYKYEQLKRNKWTFHLGQNQTDITVTAVRRYKNSLYNGTSEVFMFLLFFSERV